MWINRHKVGDYDVKFEIAYCGICHTDCHYGQNDLGGSVYPMVPGHEMAGIVTEIGPLVTRFKIGDNVGVGCIKDSCLDCDMCNDGYEQYCEEEGYVFTFGESKEYDHIGGNKDTQTFGGYAKSEVVHEHFAVKIPEGMALEKAAPMLCAGVTMYDPMKYFGALSGKKMTIGIIGIGGLGTMGIKLAKAMGHRVVAISTSSHKEAMAKEKGADAFIVSSDPDSMANEENKINLILNTVSAPHQLSHYLPLLKTMGTIVQLGVVEVP